MGCIVKILKVKLCVTGRRYMPGGEIMAHLAGLLPLKQVLRRENPR